jgi:hypothetical protein
MKLTKQDLANLSSDDITKREYNNLISRISDRVDTIWRKICKISGRKLDWWAFENDVDLGNGNGSTGGEFDPESDRDFITIIGDVTRNDSEYDDGFPTRFLWEDDWEKEVVQSLEADKKEKLKAKQSAKQKREDLKIERNINIRLIKAKLTKEELKYITFK